MLADLTISLDSHRTAALSRTPETLLIHLHHPKRTRSIHVPPRNILWAALKDNHLKLQFLHQTTDNGPLVPTALDGRIQDADADAAPAWVDALMDTAYAGLKRQKRFLVLVNPFGGPGKAPSIFRKRVEPIFKAARCQLDVTFTTHRYHAEEVAKEIDLGYDAVVALSGDGLIHELVNGLARHKEPAKAFAIPIVQIPAGSANGFSINVLGLRDGLNIPLATLNAIKGKPTRADICSVTQKDKRYLSFFTQTVGLMADLDLKTEHLRWMGDKRFMYGYLRGVLQMKTCPVELYIKAEPEDKDAMHSAYRSGFKSPSTGDNNADSWDLLKVPPPTEENTDEWYKFDKPLLSLVAGKGPYTSRDLMQFPISLSNDGYMDLLVTEKTSRTELLKSLDQGPQGGVYWKDYSRYFKSKAYRVKPISSDGCLSVDGEAFPFEEFWVEVHPRVMTFLSPYGRYADEFLMEKPKSRS